jgi:hypothetical protein
VRISLRVRGPSRLPNPAPNRDIETFADLASKSRQTILSSRAAPNADRSELAGTADTALESSTVTGRYRRSRSVQFRPPRTHSNLSSFPHSCLNNAESESTCSTLRSNARSRPRPCENTGGPFCAVNFQKCTFDFRRLCLFESHAV